MAVGAVVFDAAGRLLLVRRGRPPGEGQWSLPGGRVEAGETMIEAVVREVREETGLEVEPQWLVGVARRGEFDIHDFAARLVGGAEVWGDDATDLCWADRSTLRALDLVAQLWEFLDEHGALPPE